MAQDSSQQNQEVNLDELEVEILIICKNATSLNQSASFLTRRGWPTTVMTNMSKAIEYIAEKTPDFVLVSFSHTSPAVLKLPELITQTFNLTCVGFVETFDTASTSKLNNFKMRYKVQGAPSGPNLHRTIRKILAEKFNIGQDEGSRGERERVAASESGAVTVRGGNNSDRAGSDINVQSKPGFGSSTTVVKGGGGGPDAAGSGTAQSGVAYMPRQGSRSDAGSGDAAQASAAGMSGNIAYMPNAGGGKSVGMPHGSAQQDGGSGMASAVQSGSGGVGPNSNDAESGATDSVSSGKYTMTKPNRKSLKDLTKAGSAGVGGTQTESSPVGPVLGNSSNQGQPAAAGADLLANLKKSLFGESGADAEGAAEGEQQKAASATPPAVATAGIAANVDAIARMTPAQLAQLPPVNLLERAVDQTLRRICQADPNVEAQPLGNLTKVAVFPVDSDALSGYLVIGVQQDANKIEDFFLKSCEHQLREDFTALQVPARLEDGFWVHVPEVAFVDWATSRAQFKLVMPHEFSQVGVAYFPIERPLPKAKSHHENNSMFSINLEDISTEHPINFKAYIYLKKNKKYFLYLRNGRRLQPEQKKRLKGRRVENIFMKGVDVENLRMFLAASFLRDSIKRSA